MFHYKTLLWAQAGEDKELTQKSKGRRKNMPRAAKALKKRLYFEKKRKLFLQKPKTRN
jgi:hypothetical protein